MSPPPAPPSDFPSPTVPAVSCAVLRAGRVLLVRRGRAPEKDRWAFPGGRQEPGETAEEAVARELMEETGVTATLAGPLGVQPIPALDGRPAITLTFYLAAWTSGDGVAGDDAAEVRWVTPDEAAALPLAIGMADAIELLRGHLA